MLRFIVALILSIAMEGALLAAPLDNSHETRVADAIVCAVAQHTINYFKITSPGDIRFSHEHPIVVSFIHAANGDQQINCIIGNDTISGNVNLFAKAQFVSPDTDANKNIFRNKSVDEGSMFLPQAFVLDSCDVKCSGNFIVNNVYVEFAKGQAIFYGDRYPVTFSDDTQLQLGSVRYKYHGGNWLLHDSTDQKVSATDSVEVKSDNEQSTTDPEKESPSDTLDLLENRPSIFGQDTTMGFLLNMVTRYWADHIYMGFNYCHTYCRIDDKVNTNGTSLHLFSGHKQSSGNAGFFLYGDRILGDRPLHRNKYDSYGFGATSGLEYSRAYHILNGESIENRTSIEPTNIRFDRFGIRQGVFMFWRLGSVRLRPTLTLYESFLTLKCKINGASKSATELVGEAGIGLDFEFEMSDGISIMVGYSKTINVIGGRKFALSDEIILNNDATQGTDFFRLGLIQAFYSLPDKESHK